MPLTQYQVAQMLGVSRPRVSQLRSEGELTEMTVDEVKRYRERKEKKKAEKAATRAKWHAEQAAKRDEYEALLRGIDTKLNVLLGATGLRAAIDALNAGADPRP